jgi:hypothetical protein
MKELSQNEVRVEIGENDNGAGRYSDCRRGCSLNCCTNQIWKSLGKVQSTALNQKSSQSRNSMGCHHGHDPLVHHSWRMLEAYPAHSCRVRAASSITHLRPNGLSSAIRNRLCAKVAPDRFQERQTLRYPELLESRSNPTQGGRIGQSFEWNFDEYRCHKQQRKGHKDGHGVFQYLNAPCSPLVPGPTLRLSLMRALLTCVQNPRKACPVRSSSHTGQALLVRAQSRRRLEWKMWMHGRDRETHALTRSNGTRIRDVGIGAQRRSLHRLKS